MKAKISIKKYAAILGAALCLQASAAMAGMVTTDQMAVQNQLEVDKLKIQTFIERADVKDRLQALGVESPMAKVRVAAMTDQEVHIMAEKIDTMPAGGYIGHSDMVLILLIVLLILIL